MGEEQSVSDVFKEAMEEEVGEQSEETKPEEPSKGSQEEPKEEKAPTEEAPPLPDGKEEEKPEDRLANYRAKLSEAGLANQADQGARWYKEREEARAEAAAAKQQLDELNKFKEEQDAKAAEVAKVRAEVDQILTNAPPELKPEWGRLRQKFGDRYMVEAHKSYLEKLRQDDPASHAMEVARIEREELKARLDAAEKRNQELEQARGRAEFVQERDNTLRSLGVTAEDLPKLGRKAQGEYFSQYTEMQLKGEDPNTLRIGDVCKTMMADLKKEEEAMLEKARQSVLEEAKGKKKPKPRKEEPPKLTATTDKEQRKELRESIAQAYVDEAGGSG